MHITRIPAPVVASLVVLPAAALLAYQVAQHYPFVGGKPEPVANGRPSTGEAAQRTDDEMRKALAGRQPESELRLEEAPAAELQSAAPPPVVTLQAPRPQQVGQGLTDATVAKRAMNQPAAGLAKPMPAPADRIAPVPESSRDSFTAFDNNPLKSVASEPVSTFSVDVDTASYAFVRRMLNAGSLPPADAVRVEEMINYFDYDYPVPADASAPFSANVEIYPTPWNPDTMLLHIGLKAFDIAPETRPASNLVFLIDVSGSMNSPDKLLLLKNAFRMLLDQLGENDTVSIVTYAGEAGTVLEPTRALERSDILDAIDTLRPGGSTAGAAGIEEAYRLAERAKIEGGVNRVILATDGDFNVGISDPEHLDDYIAAKRDSGIFLSVLGFGQGNYQDGLMQALAQNGNGVAAYIDTLNEARKVLVEEAGASLFTVAKDVKVQIEFNPATVAEYRLIGYETRALNKEDFNDDRVDAGDIGSGHAVTAIYEITPAGSPAQLVDAPRYGVSGKKPAGNTDEYAFLKLRYKLPDADESTRITVPITTDMERASIAEVPDDYRFAASVAAFGQKLRGNRFVDDYDYREIVELATGARGDDPFGYRSEFVGLVRLAETLDRN